MSNKVQIAAENGTVTKKIENKDLAKNGSSEDSALSKAKNLKEAVTSDTDNLDKKKGAKAESAKNLSAISVPDSLDVRLLRWATSYGLNRSPIILMLASAVKESRNIQFWGSVNMLEALPQPRYLGNVRNETFARFVLILRNVLVFVPVALTWAAISVATSAFGTFTSQNQATTVNFLSFWQDGYGYLAPFWHIDEVARLDVIIVLAVIALTLLLGKLNNANDIEFNRGINLAEEQRLAIAMELQNFFHSRLEITDKTVTKTVAASVSGLRDMSQDMSNAMVELSKVMSGLLGDTMPRVDGVSRDLTDLIHKASDRIEELIKSLTGGVTTASTVLGDMSKTVNTIGTDAQVAVSRILDVEKKISTAGDALNSSVKKFDGAVSQAKSDLDIGLSGAIDRASIAIDNIVNEMSVTSNSLKSNARQVQDQLEELQRSLQRKITINRD